MKGKQLTIEGETIRHWERDILRPLEKAKGIIQNHIPTQVGKRAIQFRNNRIRHLSYFSDACPLCHKHLSNSYLCRGCPLAIINDICWDTPWGKFYSAVQNHELPNAIAEAKNMIAFMKARFKELGLPLTK
jgi:hypothetical protein